MNLARGRWAWKTLAVEARRDGLKRRGGKWYRIKKDGPWERMQYNPIFGWISDEDISRLRQTDPRIAP